MINNNVVTENANKYFSPSKSKKIEINIEPDLLTVRIYKRNKTELNGWFSIIEIKRFYDKCAADNAVSFKFPWELSSLNLEENEYIEIYFHLD